MKEIIKELYDLDTAEISDALDSLGIEGALVDIKAQIPGTKVVGTAFTVLYESYDAVPSEFKGAGEYIDNVPANSVIVIDNCGITDCTVWGDILTSYACTNNIAGTIVNGAIRDVSQIKKLNYPIFAKAIFMRSGKNRVRKKSDQIKLKIGKVEIAPGDYVIADDNGVLVVGQNLVSEVILRARNIRRTEEKIINALQKGKKLADARKQYRYDQPWLSQGEKDV